MGSEMKDNRKARAIVSIRQTFAAFGMDTSHLSDSEMERGCDRMSEAVAASGGLFSVSDLIQSLSRVATLGLSASDAAKRFSVPYNKVKPLSYSRELC
jgi:hypothetical protein